MALKEVEGLKVGEAPEWVRDLVIYELNPKTYTSPNGVGDGSGSGTFKSLEEKLPYMKELGINGIWMAGHTEGTTHFSNYWTVYAIKDPRNVEPTLGTKEDLKDFVKKAHEHGIKVFTEVVTHGVTFDSPLITEHPDWFNGSEWGMADYDYSNKEFVEWWIDLWTKTTLEYDFDGYRLDGPNGVSSFEQVMSVWDTITENCRKLGKEIVIIGENSRYHFRQFDYLDFTHDAAKDFCNTPKYCTMQISSHDEGIMMGTGNYYALRGSRFKFGYSAVFSYNIPLFMAGEEFDVTQKSVPNLKKKIYDGFDKSIEIDFYDIAPDNNDGQGGWLLGNQIQWEGLEVPEKKAMLEDCKKILKIKKEHRDILHYDRSETNIIGVKSIPKSGSIPYVRYKKGEKGILIVGNETPIDHEFIIKVPLKEMGIEDFQDFRIKNLWDETETIMPKEMMVCLRVFVPGDYKAGGGVRPILIEPVSNLD